MTSGQQPRLRAALADHVTRWFLEYFFGGLHELVDGDERLMLKVPFVSRHVWAFE
jgi:hypothetical protein